MAEKFKKRRLGHTVKKWRKGRRNGGKGEEMEERGNETEARPADQRRRCTKWKERKMVRTVVYQVVLTPFLLHGTAVF